LVVPHINSFSFTPLSYGIEVTTEAPDGVC